MGVLQVGGLRAGRTTLGQWIPPLVEWGRLSQAPGRSRRRTTTSRPRAGAERGQWGRTWGEGVGLRRENPAEPTPKAAQCPQR